MMITRRNKALSFVVATSLFAFACSTPPSELGIDEDNPDNPDGIVPQATCSSKQRVYTGLGGVNLTSSRAEAPIGQERARLKPFDVLVDDYRRLTNLTPSVLTESGPTFGAPAARWYTEPKPEAVALYQAYRVGFEACLELTSKDAKYAVAPTAADATLECTTLQRKYWNRTPNPEEIQACADVAVLQSLEETKAGAGKVATEPRRRWAYACASVLASPNFLTF